MINDNISLIVDMLRQSMAAGLTPFLTITSDSMAPLLKVGDQVGLESVKVEHLHIGDIITLVQNGHLLTHRFWGIDEQARPFTRGDRPFTPDPPGSSDQLLGRVIECRRQQRELSLKSGAGKRLNQYLTWLMRLESRLLTGYAPSPNGPILPPQKQQALLTRLVHRAFFIWASLAVIIFTWLAPQPHSQGST
ncbi:MAG: hypothetical protein H6667_12870 [Ardenticatenaceae bacterium]|nr:hypothetical protein [Ardenticatenaceae bacterium]